MATKQLSEIIVPMIEVVDIEPPEPTHSASQLLEGILNPFESMEVKTNDYVEGNMPHELSDLLATIASNWGDEIEVKVERLRNATNPVYRISWKVQNEESSRNVLFRLYGTWIDFLFNREEELRTFDIMSRIGFGPRLLHKFSRGRVEEFIHARTLSEDDVRDPEISVLIAAKLREFHQIAMPGPKVAVLWDRMRTWLSKAKGICTVEHIEQFRLDELDDEISLLEKEFSGEQEIGFCHNDLHYGNIMIDEKTRLLTLIDYEFSSFDPVAFDIATHFYKMTAYSLVIDYNRYPGLEERHRFIHAYLSYADKSEIEQLSEKVEKYTLASHITWGLFMIIAAYVNRSEFDYLDYARQRFQQYWMKKPLLLSV